MSRIVKVSIMAAIAVSLSCGNAKIYDVKSGRIDYEITGSGNVMGIKSQTIGKKRLIFKDYGAESLTEENKVEKTVMGGKSNVKKTHTIVLADKEILYNADMNKKRTIRMKNPAMMMMAAAGGDKSASQIGEEMLKKMGGKKIGTDKVLGYTCDVWDAMGTKQCIYKGIPLRVESNIMGLKSVEVATKVEFDIPVSDDDLKLPDFDIYDKYGKKLDKNALAGMDKKEQKEAVEGAKQLAAAMSAMAAAAKSAGVKPGETPTKEQEHSMENAMMAAMLPQMKQKILGEEKKMLEARECFSQADTLKEAESCESEMSKDHEEDEIDIREWSEEIKKEILGSIDKALAGMACVKKAESVKELKGCMQ